MHRDISPLEKKLGVKFTTQDLLRQALIHRSYLNEHRSCQLEHNERLEFLGDAVLELIVTEFLYKKYPNPEGELTNWRASLVNSQMLSLVAKQLGLEEYLHLSHGEAKEENGKARQSILANALEAVIGAIYLDGDYAAAAKFIHRDIICKLPHILKNKLYLDAKSRLQEIAQEKMSVTPGYKVLSEVGPDHRKKFTIGVFLGLAQVAIGQGSSKQEAQMQAAENALQAKGWEEQ